MGIEWALIAMTLQEAKSIARHLGLTLRQVRSGDYRVKFRHGNEMTPYYTDDLEDAVSAAVEMARTGKPCEQTKHSHIKYCVYDSTWEASDAFELDRNPDVDAWVKNDHLGFEIVYIYQGVVRKYRPDFLIRFKGGNYLVLEIKGKDTDQDKTKREFLAEWVNAVNAHGGFGYWSWDVSKMTGEVIDILARHARLNREAPAAA
jgi:type III restriction enzyme